MNNLFISFPDTTLHGIFDYYTDLPGHLSKKIANLFYILGSGEVKICSWEVSIDAKTYKNILRESDSKKQLSRTLNQSFFNDVFTTYIRMRMTLLRVRMTVPGTTTITLRCLSDERIQRFRFSCDFALF